MRKTILASLILLSSCGQNNNSSYSTDATQTEVSDAYSKMHIVFEGMPDEDKIKPMMEAVIKMYNLPNTDDQALKIGNMLYVLRKESKVGVTEMDILKDIYQHGDTTSIGLGEQGAISATMLEKSK